MQWKRRVAWLSRPLRKPLLNWTLWARSPTRIARSSCNFCGIISLSGLLICRIRRAMLELNHFSMDVLDLKCINCRLIKYI
nr:hypothetical protein CISIN_1g024800mg [Ipomoea batatas]GME16661.1 hypothetical protein CISIN_1g024800mg [Ipomoea batatas]